MNLSIFRTLRFTTFASIALVGGLAMSSCQSTPDVEEEAAPNAITKVDYFHLKTTGQERLSQDPMIYTESAKYLHGALTNAERAERVGNYYTVYWETEDEVSPLTVDFKYTQAKTGSKVLAMETTVVPSKGKGKSEYQVTGKPYRRNGRVLSWHATVSQNGKVIGTQKSFLWK